MSEQEYQPGVSDVVRTHLPPVDRLRGASVRPVAVGRARRSRRGGGRDRPAAPGRGRLRRTDHRDRLRGLLRGPDGHRLRRPALGRARLLGGPLLGHAGPHRRGLLLVGKPFTLGIAKRSTPARSGACGRSSGPTSSSPPSGPRPSPSPLARSRPSPTPGTATRRPPRSSRPPGSSSRCSSPSATSPPRRPRPALTEHRRPSAGHGPRAAGRVRACRCTRSGRLRACWA